VKPKKRTLSKTIDPVPVMKSETVVETEKKPQKRKKIDAVNPTLNQDLSQPGRIVVFTDGSCTNNGKIGAKAGIGVWFGDNHPQNLSEPLTGTQTNQRAELMAALRAIQVVKKVYPNTPFEIRSDSSYLIKGLTEWMIEWKKKKLDYKIEKH